MEPADGMPGTVARTRPAPDVRGRRQGGADQGVPAGSGRGARREWGPGEGRGRAALAGPPWLRAERGRGEEGGGPFALGRKEAG